MPVNTKFSSGQTSKDRLDTPATSGFRVGMTESGIIAHKLGRLYVPPTDMPRPLGDALRTLERRIPGK